MEKETIYGFAAALALGAFIEYALTPHLLFTASIVGAAVIARRLHAATAAALAVFYPPLTALAVVILFSPQALAAASQAYSLIGIYLALLGAQAGLGFATGRILRALLLPRLTSSEPS